MTARRNPWTALPLRAPFVLDGDRAAIDAFNRKASADRRIETDLLPEPYVGRLDAPIVLLLLNPGVSDEDFALHRRAAFRARVRACHRQKPTAYANYYLAPAITGPGAKWVTRVMRPLLVEFGAKAVANCVTLLEYFPYHARKFAHRSVRIPSQDFTFDLLRSAISRDAAIFITRGEDDWQAAVPELLDYPRAFTTRSKQNVVVSPNNCPVGYAVAHFALLQAVLS